MKYHPKTAEERRTEIDALLNRISQGTEEYIKSGKYKEILDNLSKFHQYSLNNSLLIALQNPTATYVASYTTWKQKFNRQVNAGEKSIKIFCPVIHQAKEKNKLEQVENDDGKISAEKINNKQEKATLLGFKLGSVFDVSQTAQIAGKEVIDFIPCRDLYGIVDKFDIYFAAIKEVAPVSVEMKQMNESVKGYYDRQNEKIVIQEGMSEVQTIKTAIHELAHAIIHSDEKENEKRGFSRADKEVQAESTAYVVSKHFGIDTEEYSFPYVIAWAGDIDRINNNLTIVKKAADYIIDHMENSISMHMDHLKMEDEVSKLSPTALAKKLTEFSKDFDPYSFADNENYSGEIYDRTLADVRHGRLEAIKAYLAEVVEESNEAGMKNEGRELLNDIDMYEKNYLENDETLKMSKEFKMKL